MSDGKPLLIFDGRCGFCKIWIHYWKQLTHDRVEYAASQDVGHQFPQIPPEEFSKSVQLVRADGSVARGARAVFETLGWERVYESTPLLAPVSEWAYRTVAAHRNLFYQVTRALFGARIEPARFAAVQWIFLRMLAAIYAIAFASLALQVSGLIGSQGITPAAGFLDRVGQVFETPQKYFAVPTLFWIDASDGVLLFAAWAGVVVAIVALAGYFQRVAFFLLYAVYLSFTLAGQVFLAFQWDALLLEAGFLAIFFGNSVGQQRRIAWVYRLLVFRLYFLSGFVKLASGDETWRNLTALEYHFHTQPLPNGIAWYLDQVPASLLRALTFASLAIELVVPFCVFLPRRIRMAGAWAMIALQASIFLSGNYTFFNLLAAALTIFLFDDLALQKLLRRNTGSPEISRRWQMAGRAAAGIILALGLMRFYESVAGELPRPLAMIANGTAQFQIANPYGLFAVMTKTRPEIVIEGSDDGVAWKEYAFRYKPGDVMRGPRWVEPYQPRLDWQMWFAALGPADASPWFESLIEKLLLGLPEVEGLLERKPFPDHPPKYIRALLYDYTFTSAAVRAQTGAWWKRQLRGTYFPAVSLRR